MHLLIEYFQKIKIERIISRFGYFLLFVFCMKVKKIRLIFYANLNVFLYVAMQLFIPKKKKKMAEFLIFLNNKQIKIFVYPINKIKIDNCISLFIVAVFDAQQRKFLHNIRFNKILATVENLNLGETGIYNLVVLLQFFEFLFVEYWLLFVKSN